MIDWDEVEKLLRLGYRPYRFKAGKKHYEYMCLKKGRDTRGLGRFNEDDWNRLKAKETIIFAERLKRQKEKSLEEEKADKTSPQFVKVDDILIRAKQFQIAEVFEWLRSGYSPAEIVMNTTYRPEFVEACTKRYYEMKELANTLPPQKGEEEQSKLPKELQLQLSSMKHQLDETVKTQNKLVEAQRELKDMLEPILFRGKVKMTLCVHRKESLCTLNYDPNLIKGAPIEVVKEKDGSIHVKTIPAWCAVCPYYST